MNRDKDPQLDEVSNFQFFNVGAANEEMWPRKGATHGRIGRKSKMMFEQRKPFLIPVREKGSRLLPV
jgi:hypothetical protein